MLEATVKYRLRQQIAVGASVACVWALATDACADDANSLQFEASAGYSHDSNVTAESIDLSSNQSDDAATFRARLGFRLDLADRTPLSVRYSFEQTSYADLSEFDLQTHLVSAQLAHRFNAIETGVAYRYASSSLGGAAFLVMQQVEPFISYRTGDVLLRASYTYKDKSFDGRPNRDARVDAAGIDAYYFFHGADSYLLLSYDYESEDAQVDYIDREVEGLKARIAWRLPLGARDGKFSLGARYERRDYDGLYPLLGAPREDERTRLDVQLEFPLSDHVFLATEYEHTNSSSNVAAADYGEQVASLRIGVRY